MNVHYNTPDESTGNQMLQIACNMNKCKYSVLNKSSFNNCKYNEVYIYISLNSLFLDWYNLTNGEFGDCNDEEIMARIFETIIHYKNYFENHLKIQNVKFFLYYSFEWQKSFNTIQFQKDEDFSKNLEIKSAIEKLTTIVMYIPGTYVINSGSIHPGIIPFFVESERKDQIYSSNIKGYNHSALIVSAQDIDYSALGITIPGLDNKFDLFGFRRRHDEIFDKDNVFETVLFKHKQQARKYVGYYLWFYPKVLTMNAGKFKLVNSSDYISKDMKKDINRHLYDTNISDLEMSNWMSEISDKISLNSRLNELNRMVDIPRAYNDNLFELRQKKNVWKSDRIDYSIESLNDAYFKHFRIDWASLF